MKARSTHIITSLLILFAINIVTVWGQSTQERIAAHKQWVAEHTSKPEQLTDEQLIITVADIICGLSHEPAECKLIEACGKWEQSFVTYAEHRKKNMLDKGYDEAIATLKRLEAIAIEKTGEHSLATANCRYAQASALSIRYPALGLSAIEKCIKSFQPSTSNKEEMARALLFESIRLTLQRNCDISNPLLWRDIFALEKNVADLYRNWDVKTEVRANTYQILGALKGNIDDYTYEIHAAGNEIITGVEGVPPHFIYSDNQPTNSEAYFRMALEIGKASLGEFNPNNAYFLSDFAWFLVNRSIATDSIYQEIREMSSMLDEYLPSGDVCASHAKSLKWRLNYYFSQNMEEIKEYKHEIVRVKDFYGEYNENYIYYLSDVVHLLSANTTETEQVLTDYLAAIEKAYNDNPCEKCMMLTMGYSTMQAVAPDKERLDSYREIVTKLYKDNHKAQWKWLYIGNQLTWMLSSSYHTDEALEVYALRLADLKQLVGKDSPTYGYALMDYANGLPHSRWSESISALNEVQKCFKQKGISTTGVKRDMANIYAYVKEYEKCFALMKEAIEEAKLAEEKYDLTNLQLTLAAHYLYSGKVDANVYKPIFEEYIPVLLASKNEMRMADIDSYVSAADYYRSQKQYNKAIDILYDGVGLYDSRGGRDESVFSNFFTTLVEIYYNDLNQYDNALQIIDSEVKRLRELDENGNISYIANYLLRKWQLVYSSNNILKITACMYELANCANVVRCCYGDNFNVQMNIMLPLMDSFRDAFNYFQTLINNVEKEYAEFEKQDVKDEKTAQQYKILSEQIAGNKKSLSNFREGLKEMLQTITDAIPANIPNYEQSIEYNNILARWEQYYEYVEPDKEKCEEYLEKCIDNSRKHNQSLLIPSLSAGLKYYWSKGDYEKTDDIIRQLYAEKAHEKLSNENVLDMISIEYFVKYKRGEYKECIPLAREYNQRVKSLIGDNFDLLSHNEREEFLNRRSAGGGALQMLLHACPKEISAEVYDEMLFQKGLLLRSSERIRRSVLNSGDTKLIALMDSVERYRSQFSKDVGFGVSKTYNNEDFFRQQNMYVDIERMEHEIARRSAQYILEKEKEVTWTQVQQCLKKDEVAIEFCFSDSCIGALIVKSGLKQPEYVEFANATTLYNDVNALTKLTSKGFSELLYADDSLHLYNRLWHPMERVLAGCKKIYLSPTGFLTNIAFHAIKTPDGKALMDKYDICQLTSTAEIARKHKSEQKFSKAAIYGGIYYDQKQASKYATTTTSAATLHPAERAYEDDRGTKSEAFTYLPGTLQEINDISSILVQGGVKTVSGIEATEEAFNKYDGNSPDIIHLATHGFFVKEKDVETNTFVSRFTNARYDAMLRAGLALVNANETWKRKITDDETRDGILTAKDISLLDLSNTDLMVISACETAIGIYSNEGVYGLQRGIKQAGVASMIASLWKVNDLSTAYFMSQFYGSLSKGMSKRQSMKYAIQQTREKYPSPFNWAPFVMIDGL